MTGSVRGDQLPNALPHTTATQVPFRRLQRSMDARHLIMIALGGVIGSGLFLSSGYTIHQAGPLGAVIAYGIGALVVYLVMPASASSPSAYPAIRGRSTSTPRDPSIRPPDSRRRGCTGCAGSSRSDPSSPRPASSCSAGSRMSRSGCGASSSAPLFTLNAISARVFGETEFWFSLVKVAAIIGLIVLGGAAIFGFTPPLRLPDTARRFDTSPAWFSWVGTEPALELLNEIGVEAIHEHDLRLANRFRAGLGLEPSDSAIVIDRLPRRDREARAGGDHGRRPRGPAPRLLPPLQHRGGRRRGAAARYLDEPGQC